MVKKLLFLIPAVVLLCLAGNVPAEEEAVLHIKVDLALPLCGGGIWQDTLKPGWIPWAQARWHDMYGHDCVMANGTGEEASCGAPYEGKPGLGGSGIMAAMSCLYEGRGALIAAGPEMCNLNADCPCPAVTGQVLYEPICNTWYMITDFGGWPGSTILLALYNLPAGEYKLKSYHNRFRGERNGGQPHWEDIGTPEPPMSRIRASAIAAALDLFPDYVKENWELSKFMGTYDLGSPEGVELLEGADDVEIQQVTRDQELVPSVIRFRTDGSPVMVVYEGNDYYAVPDDIRPQRESQRAVLNAFELLQTKAIPIAGFPTPINGAEDVPIDVVLTWRPGGYAVRHDVYFGSSELVVGNADDPDVLPGRGRQSDTSYAPSGPLDYGTTYYWKIDEVNDANIYSPWQGQVWSFTTEICPAEFRPTTDLTGDCKVNLRDHAMIAADWRDSDAPILAVGPSPDGLMAWYKFDGSADDYSGNGFYGRLFQEPGIPNPRWESGGKFSGCLAFVGEYGVKIVEPGAAAPHVFSDVNEAVTISLWINGYAALQPDQTSVILRAYNTEVADTPIIDITSNFYDNGWVKFVTGESDSLLFDVADTSDWAGKWNHFAFVKDSGAGIQRIYHNGCLAAEQADTFALMGGIDAATFGIAPDGESKCFFGRVDDVRIYNYALSQAELASVMAESSLYCPLTSPANFSDDELTESKVVDFKDYAVLAESWLEKGLLP